MRCNPCPKPHNVLIWNEVLQHGVDLERLMSFRRGEEPSIALSPDVVEGPTAAPDDEMEAVGSADGTSELPEIEEEVLSPEGEPIEDWKPQAASSLEILRP